MPVSKFSVYLTDAWLYVGCFNNPSKFSCQAVLSDVCLLISLHRYLYLSISAPTRQANICSTYAVPPLPTSFCCIPCSLRSHIAFSLLCLSLCSLTDSQQKGHVDFSINGPTSLIQLLGENQQ